MKIVLVSNWNTLFLNTNYYRAEALRALGHEVVFFDVRRYIFPGRVRAWLPSLASAEREWMNNALVRCVQKEKPGLCLVVGGADILPKTVRCLRALGMPVFLWTTDAPHPDQMAVILPAAKEYSRIFCAGTEAVDILRNAGVAEVEWLPFACDPERHAPAALRPEDEHYRRDISFVGAYYPNRLSVLETLAEMNLGIWGPHWNRVPAHSSLREKTRHAWINVDEWVKIYSWAGIVLVVHFQDGKIPCYQASPKLFEAMACGAFVLCDDQKDARAIFKEGEHVVFFKDAADLKDKARYYLEHPALRARIAAAGRQEALARHTYQHRMRVIMDAAGGRI
ncbi:MAG: glycosyltransferase [Candidatus Omnitrophica bacterium]|nr:glycosyltransferase [Candidatus Omnitrophota bacterium]